MTLLALRSIAHFIDQLTSETSPEGDEVGGHVPVASGVLSPALV